MAQNFLLCAHCVYEAQLESSDKILSQLFPMQSKENTIIFSAQTISPFEELIVAHFLSTTTEDHIWEIIDFSNCL